MAPTLENILKIGCVFVVVFILIPLALILMVFSIPWVICYFESTVTSSGMTTTAMTVDEVRIFDYIRAHGSLPRSLSELPTTDGKIDGTKDGWGRTISYSVDTNGIVTLVSLGADGKPGGRGEAADIILSFPTKDSKCNWLQALPNDQWKRFSD